MSQTKKYDVIVIGSGITGLLAAHVAHSLNQKVLLLEARDVAGGAVRPIQTDAGSLPSSLDFIPATEIAETQLTRLGQILGSPIYDGIEETRPLTFDAGEFKSFVGFGDRTLESITEIAFYNMPRRLRLLSSPSDWIHRLLELGVGESELLSEVTGFDVEDARITAIHVNAARTVIADKIIFTASPKLLEGLFAQEALNPKTRTRIAKAHSWTSVGLHLEHQDMLTNEMGLHFLMGSSEDFEPCLGRFFPAGEQGQKSCWISLISEAQAEDTEFIGDTIRYMKRQIKRAYPAALDDMKNEKIVVSSHSHGHMQLKLKDFGLIQEISNLFLASPLVSEHRGLVGAIEQGLRAVAWATPEPEIEKQLDA